MSNHTQNYSISNTLLELGLAENEASLYQLLIDYPDATIPLLRQKSPLSRQMLYYVIDNLSQKGLIETGKQGKKTVYNAAPPERLEELFTIKQKELARQKELLQGVISDLRSSYLLAHKKPGVRFYQGPSGFKEALYDTLTATETIYTFVDVEELEKHAKTINDAYVAERRNKKINKKILVQDTPFARNFFKHLGNDRTTVRFLPTNVKPFKTGMQIYNNKISYFTLRPDNIIAVIIDDADVYQLHRSLFEYIWELAEEKKTIAHGGDGQGSATVFN